MRSMLRYSVASNRRSTVPDAVLTSTDVALADTVVQRGGAFNKGCPFLHLSCLLVFDWLMGRNRDVDERPTLRAL